jgi:hypothetical protein
MMFSRTLKPRAPMDNVSGPVYPEVHLVGSYLEEMYLNLLSRSIGDSNNEKAAQWCCVSMGESPEYMRLPIPMIDK